MNEDERADELLGVCRERLDRGEPLDAETVLREHPDLAPVLRQRLAVLALLHASSGRGAVPPAPDSGSLTGAVLGPYRIGAKLGEGGMGTVYEARVEGRAPGVASGARVAVKVVHAHLLSRPGSFKRFLREAEIGRAVRHENVVATLDSDAAELSGRVVHFLAMEFVEGQTLRELLDELGRVPEELCRHVGREVAKGLAAIHAAGVVHRDLKPENVIISRSRASADGDVAERPGSPAAANVPARDGHVRITAEYVVKVMDLGVARLEGEEARLSQTGAFVGSLSYGAPEQFVRTAEVDGRADLYSLGLTLYELATGRHPFADDDVRVVIQRQLHEKARPASELNPQLSPLFEELLAQLLEKDRDARPAAALDVVGILEEGEESAWWRERSKAIRAETKRPLRRIRIPRETALYGRDAELVRLRALFDRASAGDGQVVLIEGEAGIGKSRLVDEFVGQLAQSGEDINFLFGSYPPGGAATASGAFSTAYREHLGDDESAIRAALPQTPLLVPAFAALLRGDGAPTGGEPLTKDSLQTVFVHATRSLAGCRPTIVLIDDLHFAPEEGRSLFMSLALAVPGHRILLVGCTRPGLDEKWVRQLAAREQTSQMSMPRLTPKELVHLLRDALGSERLAEELAGLIAVKSDGNPFFVFEMLRGLRDGQFLRQRPDGTWETTQIIRDIQVPSSVLELVQARVADLATGERDLLDVAACCGFEFDPGLVAEVTGLGRIPALKSLAQVERAHRLVRASGRRFVFDHHQVQEALYGSLPEMLREEYHGSIADAIERRDGAAAKDPKDLDGALCVELAEHFLKGAKGERGLRYLDAGLRHLVNGYLLDAAARLSDVALAIPGLVAGRERCELLLRNSWRLEFLGRSAEERACLDEANLLAATAADSRLRVQVLTALGGSLRRASRHDEARRVLDAAIELATAAGDAEGEAGAQRYLGNSLADLGRFEEARPHFQRQLDVARAAGSGIGEAAALGDLGNVFLSISRFDEARTHYERHLAIAQQIGDRVGEATATGNLGALCCTIDRFDEARAHIERQLALATELGMRRSEASALGNLGPVFLALGRVREAREYLERRVALAGETANRLGESIAVGNLGIVARVLGRHDEAKQHSEHALGQAREIGHRYGEGYWLNTLASLAADAGEAGEAERLFAEALEVRRRIGHEDGTIETLADLGGFLAEHGRFDESRVRLSEALSIARRIGAGDTVLFAATRLAALPGGDPTPALEAFADHEKRCKHTTKMEARFLLWQATRDPAHLADAKRLLDHLVEYAPPDCRESMLANVRLHREIAAAAKEQGLDGPGAG